MSEKVDTVIIGGGQAGLAASYYLTNLGLPHVVLEQAAQPGHAWRDQRWDSFTFVTPNWTFRLPGSPYQGSAPDGFMSRRQLVTAFEEYVRQWQLPVRYQAQVSAVRLNEAHQKYQVIVNDAELEARSVIVATGLFQRVKFPPGSAEISPHITQLHSSQYRNPGVLPSGAVLVVGSAQSGCQIAEELYLSGRKVYLSTGSGGRAPRRYRGKDIFEWLDKTGFLDRTPDKLPSPRARFSGHPHLSGCEGGRTLNLHQFVRDGVTLLGRYQGGQDDQVYLAPDRNENLAKADQFERQLVNMVDDYILRSGLEAPPEDLPVLSDGFAGEEVTTLDLSRAGIQTIIWAAGYGFDFNLVQLPVCDDFGFPVTQRGLTAYRGLYFLGLPWLWKHKSGILLGVGEDAEHIARDIADKTR